MKGNIAFLDTETTDLIYPKGTHIDIQPRMIEICIISTNQDLEIIKKDSCLLRCNPGRPSTKAAFRVHGITEEEVAHEPDFGERFKPINKILKKASMMVAQNYMFDRMVLKYETQRLEKKFNFPAIKYCTAEQSRFLTGRRMKLSELYYLATGYKEYDSHSADGDVLAMIEVFRWLRRMS